MNALPFGDSLVPRFPEETEEEGQIVIHVFMTAANRSFVISWPPAITAALMVLLNTSSNGGSTAVAGAA